jgi:hypothetical protein
VKGEAHGRSNTLDVLGGVVVYVAKGVTKPRTWHATVEGSAVNMRVYHADTVP